MAVELNTATRMWNISFHWNLWTTFNIFFCWYLECRVYNSSEYAQGLLQLSASQIVLLFGWSISIGRKLMVELSSNDQLGDPVV